MNIRLLLLLSLFSVMVLVTAEENGGDFTQDLETFLQQRAVESQAQQIALPIFRQEAEQGDPYAQYNLGLSYATGRGVPKDTTHAAYWYQKAAEQGMPQAQYNLGLLYEQGQGVEHSDAKALHWYRQAALQGVPEAQTNLGAMYETGEGVPTNAEEAVYWYRKAARQRYPVAQYNLGLSYLRGQGVERDVIEGYLWLTVAKRNYPEAAAVLARLDQLITPAQRDHIDWVLPHYIRSYGAR